jgi:DNA sulfur modification protein DndD
VYTGIELDGEYRLHLKIKDQSTIPAWERGPSAGQSQVIAHSFIAALNKFTAKEAPIIIDTPLARLDDIHAEKIVKSYPAMGKQVIVLYQPRELDERLIASIKSHIRAEYDIKRDLVDQENSLITRRTR